MLPRERPVLLLTATLRWPIAARLAMAFAEHGAMIQCACPKHHPARRTRAVQGLHAYSALQPLTSLRAAIAASRPDLVIPCDDDAARHLQQLHARCGPRDAGLRQLIERSLGAPDACALAADRGALIALAVAEGVRVAPTTQLDTPAQVSEWAALRSFPAVLKTDGTWGGLGVAVVGDAEQARRTLAHMAARPSLSNALVRMLLDRDATSLLTALRPGRRGVTSQEFIVGTPANRAVACWRGRVLAGISVMALHTQHATGPATLVRIIDHPEMASGVARLVGRLGLSGFWGVDFMLDENGAAHLIEVNPRATPITHLVGRDGQNLAAALLACLTGLAPIAAGARIDNETVALFPGEWRRDAASPHLFAAHHDVPWGEPALVQELARRPWSERGWIARLWERLRPQAATPGTRGLCSPSNRRYTRRNAKNASLGA